MGTITEDNFLVWNQGKNPLVNFNFMLRVELLYDLPCKSVKAFTREMEYEFIQEGGVNDYVHMRRKPITRPFTLEVERYVGVDYLDPMPLGADLALPVLLFVGRAPNQFIPFVVARTYVFTGCTVMKKVYGELVGDRSGLLVETTTLGYREMLCVDIPWSAVTTDVGAEYATPATNSLQDEARLQQLKAQSSDAVARAETASQDAQRYAAEAADVAAQLEAQLAAAMAEEGSPVTEETAKARRDGWADKLKRIRAAADTAPAPASTGGAAGQGTGETPAAEKSAPQHAKDAADADALVQKAATVAEAQSSLSAVTTAASGAEAKCREARTILEPLRDELELPAAEEEDPEAAARRAAALEERRAKAAAAEAERAESAGDAQEQTDRNEAALEERRAKAAAAEAERAESAEDAQEQAARNEAALEERRAKAAQAEAERAGEAGT